MIGRDIIQASQITNYPNDFDSISGMVLDAIAKQITEGIAEHYKNNPHTTFDLQLDFPDDYAKAITDTYFAKCTLTFSLTKYLSILPFVDTTRTYILSQNGQLILNIGIMEDTDWVYDEDREELKCCWGEYLVTEVEDETQAQEAFELLYSNYGNNRIPIGEYTYNELKEY